MPNHSLTRIGRFFPASVSRPTARQLAALDQGELFAKAVVSAETRIAHARIDSLVDVTESAMLGASHIASVGGCLAAATPWAERPLASIAEVGFAGLRQIVHRQARGDR